jgi:hypothetical protein
MSEAWDLKEGCDPKEGWDDFNLDDSYGIG